MLLNWRINYAATPLNPLTLPQLSSVVSHAVGSLSGVDHHEGTKSTKAEKKHVKFGLFNPVSVLRVSGVVKESLGQASWRGRSRNQRHDDAVILGLRVFHMKGTRVTSKNKAFIYRHELELFVAMCSNR